MKHTPGPWKAFRQTESERLGWAVTTVDEKGPDITGWGGVTQNEANARFIANAPELEAEVERLREELDTAVCRVCLQRLVREAEATSPSDDWRRDLAEM
jgi:hypothetical protein